MRELNLTTATLNNESMEEKEMKENIVKQAEKDIKEMEELYDRVSELQFNIEFLIWHPDLTDKSMEDLKASRDELKSSKDYLKKEIEKQRSLLAQLSILKTIAAATA